MHTFKTGFTHSLRYYHPLLLLLLLGAALTACSVAPIATPSPPSATAPTSSAAAVDGLPYLGTANLPAGFDAQGHRGARGLLPENTLPSFEAALDLGVSTLEVDLHFSSDGSLVVWHDPIIGKEKCSLPETATVDAPDPRNPLRRILISQQPLALLQAYQCDQNPDRSRYPEQEARPMPLAGSDYRIVTLPELFDFVRAYAASDVKSAAQQANAAAVRFNLELKRDPDHPEYINDGFTGGTAGPFELALLDAIADAGLQQRVVIQSFDHRSLRTIREVDADVPLAALTTGGEAKLKVYRSYKFNIWSPNYRDLSAALVAEAHAEGLVVIPWTINDATTMQQLIDWEVDGIISDRPDLLLSLDSANGE